MSLRQPLFSVLPRSRASLVLLAASLVMTTAATAAIAAVPLYVDAIEQSGFRRVLTDAAPLDVGIEVVTRTTAADAAATNAVVAGAVADDLPGDLDSLAITRTDSYGIVDGPGADVITSLATIDSTQDVIRVVDGGGTTVPGAAPDDPTDTDVVTAWLHVDAATELGLQVGDTLSLDGRDGADVVVVIVALFEPTDGFDRLWFDTPIVRDGVVSSGSFTDIGPLITDPTSFARIDRAATTTWRGVVDPSSVSTSDIDGLGRAALGMPDAVGDALDGATVDVRTDLPTFLADTDVALGSTRAVVAVVLLQLVGLALYGLSLAATVITSTRDAETTLLRSRGASALQLGCLAAVEALLVVIPAVVIGPIVATVLIERIGRWGPVATAGLDLESSVTSVAVLGACAVGALAVAIIGWPALRAARSTGSAVARQGRPDDRGLLRRSGADLVLAAAAIGTLWRLTGTSATTRDATGAVTLDPILALAPTLGVIAASLITLRLVDVAARSAQRGATRWRGLAPSLAGRVLARRPTRSARTVVLIVLAVSVGTFATTQGATWRQSQIDQADAVATVDIRVTPDSSADADAGPSLAVADAYLGIDGVASAAPLTVTTAAITAEVRAVTAVAADTVDLRSARRLRSDLTGDLDDPGVLHAPVDLGGIPLGHRTGDLTFHLLVGASGTTPTADLGVAVVLVDGAGTVHRVPAASGAAPTGESLVTIPLVGPDTPSGDEIQLVQVELTAPVPLDPPASDSLTDPTTLDLTLSDVQVGGRAVGLESRAWSVVVPPPTATTVMAPEATATSTSAGVHIEMTTGTTTQIAATTVVKVSTTPETAAETAVVPAAVSDGLQAALDVEVGDRITATIDGVDHTIQVVTIVPAVPFATSSSQALLMDWSTLSAARYARSGRVAEPTEWALTLDPGSDHVAVAATLAAPPWNSVAAVDRSAVAQDLAANPLTIGLLGGFALALVASLVVAVVGLLLSAVVGSRERRPAYSVLRALGTPSTVLRRWLLLETVPLVAIAAASGLVTGLVLVQTTMTSLTVGDDGNPAIPPPEMVVPWPSIGIILGVAVATGVALPLVTARLLGRHRPADDLRIGDGS